MLSFLFPLMWLSAAAVAVPLWLHLRRRDEARLVRFSAMRFLDDQPLARQRPLLPRHWPLMLLRMLLVLLIAAAFAWPYMATESEVLIRESRVYILDNTLSHQAGSRFAAARDTIADAIAGAQLDTQIAVIELKREPAVLVQFGDAAPAAAARVRGLRPAFERGSYLAAFRMAQNVIDQALGSRRRIFLMGDSQQNQWEEAASVPPFLTNVEVELPENELDELPNVAVQFPKVRRVFQGPLALAQCAFRVYRHAGPKTARLTVTANGQPVLDEEVDLSQQPETTPTLAVQFEHDPTVWLRGAIHLQAADDRLDGDNRAFFSLPPVRPGSVVLLADSLYLRTALSPSVMGTRWNVSALSSNDRPDHTDDDYLLEAADVLCLESSFLKSSATRALVLDYLNNGRGVVLIVGRSSPAAAGLLRDFGIQLLPDPPPTGQDGALKYVYMEHPIFQPFRSADFGDLTQIAVKRYRRLEMAAAMPLAFASSGDPLLFESTKARGRLLVFAFNLSRDETNWPLHPSFVPFLDRCLHHARRGQEGPGLDYEPGEVCVWNLDERGETRQVVLRRVGGSPNEQIHHTASEGQARFAMPDTPGHYELRYADDPSIQAVLNVNAQPAESELAFADAPPTLAAWKRTSTSSDEPSFAVVTAEDLSRQEILRQNLWWWLVVAVLIAFATETAWIALRKGLT